MQSNMQAVNALASFVSGVFCWKNKAELLFWSLLYRSLILETNLQCVIWKYSGNSFFSFQQKTSPPRKKACKIRPNPTRISPTFLPLISTSVSPSCSLQLCKLSFKHTHTWHEPARAPWNLEKYYLCSLLSFRKVKQVSLKPWWIWWVCTSICTCYLASSSEIQW